MKRIILVTGSNGQLGSELKELSIKYYDKFLFADKQDLDITDKNAIRVFLIENKITDIINCAAYTNVDKAESEKEIADAINNKAVGNLADFAKEFQIKLVHISTDYVFDGTGIRPYTESDKTNPKSVYGSTKLSGEQAMIKVNPPNSIIIRTSWLYSIYGNNFVKTIIKLGQERDKINVVSDQTGTPTYARDLAKAILDILPKLHGIESVGIFHYSNYGECTWAEFASEIFELSKTQCFVNKIDSKDYPTIAQRPKYSVLDKTKIKTRFGITIPNWKDSLKECIMKLK